MPIIGIVNQKGGVGKTTTAINVGAGLADKGQSVLLVDCDPQGNATTGIGVDKARINTTLYDVIAAAADDNNNVIAAFNEAKIELSSHLHVVPATLDLAGAEPILLNAVGKEMILKDTLDEVSNLYDWVILDAPPSLGLLTINILATADGVIVPMQCEFFALEGLSQLVKTVELVRRRINPKLKISKVVITMYDPRSRLTHEVLDQVTAFFGDKVSPIMIPRNIRLSEAASFGEAAVDRFPRSKGSVAYKLLVEELIQDCEKR
jgi:chromosome partitioning protein